MLSLYVILKGLNKELDVLQAIWKNTKVTIDSEYLCFFQFCSTERIKASFFDVCFVLFLQSLVYTVCSYRVIKAHVHENNDKMKRFKILNVKRFDSDK